MDATELVCRHPLASAACLAIWLPLSLPFFAAGGTWSLLSLTRRRRDAPSSFALYAAVASGFVFAFVSVTALAVMLDVLHLHPGSAGIELPAFLIWVFAWQTGYVRLVFRIWTRHV